MTISHEALGRAIAAARQPMTQEALGEATGLGQTTISRIETGDRRLGATELIAIANALQVDVADLLRGATVDSEPADEAEGVQLVAMRLERSSPAKAGALSWVTDFLERLEDLESRLGE